MNNRSQTEMKQTQAQRILEALKRGESITALDALNWFGCFRLAARVYDLRKAGHNIKSGIRVGSGKPVTTYYMHIIPRVPQPQREVQNVQT